MDAHDNSGFDFQLVPSSTRVDVAVGRRVVCQPEEPIFFDGDPADHRYEVVSGAVRACKLLPDGRRQIFDFLLPGDMFGHDSLDGTYSYSAEAADTQETVVLQRRRRAGAAGMVDDSDTIQCLREQALRTLEKTRTHLLILGRLEAPERVAAFLLEMEARLRRGRPPQEATSFILPMSRRDAADYLGLTPETLSRCIQDLRRRAVIEIVRQRHLRILDRRTLVALSCGTAELSGGCPAHDPSRLPAVAYTV